MRQYRINGEFLDNFDDDSFAISKAISKIGEINLRHGDRSTGFKVKWTSKNIKLLNYITILNSANNSDSFKKILGQIVEDDVVISDGYFQVTKFNPYKKDIDIRFYGGNTDWFSELKDKKINETDRPEDGSYSIDDLVNLTFSSQNITDNILNNEVSTENPYKFFLVDNNKNSKRNASNDSTLNTFVEDYQIGFSQGVIFDRVFESLGIKTKGNMFNDPLYYNTLISNSVSLKEPFSDEFEYLAEQSNTLNQSLPVIGNPTAPLTFDIGDPVNEWDGQKITLQSTASGLFFNCNLQCITQNDNTPDRDLLIEIYRNNTLIYTDTIQETGDPFVFGQGTTLISAFYTYNFDTGSSLSNFPGGFSEGDEISLRFASEFIPSRSNWRTTDNVYEENAFLFFELDNYIKKEKANEYIPGINQSVFVKDVLAQFGAITQYDPGTKTLTCNKFDKVDDNRSKSPDWSNKIDLSTPPTVDLVKILSKYGKSSVFKYQENEDADILNKLYKSITNYSLGQGALKIKNDFLEDEKVFYNSPYSPTINTQTFPSEDPSNVGYQIGNFYIPFVPIYTFTGVDDTGVRQYDENDINPRKYLHLGNIPITTSQKGNCVNISVNDGVSSISISDIPLVYFDKDDYPSFSDSLLNNYNESLAFSALKDLTVNTFNYGDTVINKKTILKENYSFQKKILDNPIYLEIYLKLSPLDVQNVDFFTPIFLDFDLDSGYYYIDEISQYKGQDQSTKVKLVKI